MEVVSSSNCPPGPAGWSRGEFAETVVMGHRIIDDVFVYSNISEGNEPPERGTYRDACLTARQGTIFYAVDRRLGSWPTVSDDVPGGT